MYNDMVQPGSVTIDADATTDGDGHRCRGPCDCPGEAASIAHAIK